nr:hypothetical protein [Tanacetum cinerariifolium]
MAPQTRSLVGSSGDDTESLRQSNATLMREEMEKLMAEMRNAAMEATASGSGAMVRPQADGQRGMRYHKVTNVEFPRFEGVDVRGWMPLLPNLRFTGPNSTYPNSPKPVNLPTPNSNWRTRTANPNTAPIRKQLTHKELEEKRAKNICFYYDQRYVPGHKFLSQMFSLEVVADNDEEEIVWNPVNEDGDCELSDFINAVQEENSVPHISLNALQAKKLGCPLTSTYPLQVTVANGHNMMTSKMCRMKWNLQESVVSMVSAKPNTQDVPQNLQFLLEEYNDVFEVPKELPPVRSHDHRIPLKEGTLTINIRPYRHPDTQKDAIERYYRRFVRNYAMISSLLTKLLKKNAFVWGKEAEQAFTQLKEAMMAAPVLKLPNFEEEFVIETDASGEGIGAVLQQHGHPITYLSKDLSSKHQLLSTYEKEFLAVLQALDKWRGYLLDRHFKIKTDHLSLKDLLDQRISTPTQMKWLPKLMGFDYEIEYKKGKDNVVADALSEIQGNVQLLNMVVSTFTSDVQQRIVESWSQDEKIQTLIAKLKDGKACPKHYSWSNNLLTRKGKLVVGNDSSLQHDLIEYFHAGTMGGHSGIMVITHSMCALLYWKKMRKHIKQFVNECCVCQLNKADLAASPGLLQPLPIPQRVWSEISMDFIDGLPASKAYHPQSDGQTEVVNRCLEGFLRCMTGERPKEWVHWLPLVEYWYNTNYHTSINTTPFEVLYGEDEEHGSEREFILNDRVYVKLQPYRQISLRKGKHHKLSPKFYGPYQIIARIGKVAYRLNLPASSIIHPVFHVSQLKAHKGDLPNSQQALPEVNEDCVISDRPKAVLGRKKIKTGAQDAEYVLVQWENGAREDATWELLTDMVSSYP